MSIGHVDLNPFDISSCHSSTSFVAPQRQDLA